MTGLAELPLLFSWPASSVHTTFTGDSISATLSALPATATYDVSSRFAFRVDEELKGEETTTIGHTVIRWHATGLGSGDDPVRQPKPAYSCLSAACQHAVKPLHVVTYVLLRST